MRANDYSPLQAMWPLNVHQTCRGELFSDAYIGLKLFSYGKCFFYSSILKISKNTCFIGMNSHNP